MVATIVYAFAVATPSAVLLAVALLVIDGGPSVMLMLKAWVSNKPPVQVARMFPVNNPSVVGVPEIVPVEALIVRPGGSAPEEIVKVVIELQAATLTPWEYATPVCPAGGAPM